MNKEIKKVTEIIKFIDPNTKEEIEYIAKHYTIDKAKETEDDRTLEFIVSDEELDRDYEKILLSAWKLNDYKKAPIVLHNHQRGGESVAVGKTVRIWKDNTNKQLKARIKFPELEESPLGDRLYKLYKGGYMYGVSPGFIPNRDKMIFGQKEKEARVTYCDIDLFEISLVTIPANPRALVQLKSFGGIKKAIKDGVVNELEINELEMFINKNIKKSNEHSKSELKNINNNQNDDSESNVVNKDSETEIMSNSFLIVDNEDKEIKYNIKEDNIMDKENKKEMSVQDIVDAVSKKFEERAKIEAEEAAKEAELKALKEENEKLKKEQETIIKSPAFDMSKFKTFGKEKGSGIEAGPADEFMGFKMKAQDKRNEWTKGMSEKEADGVKKWMVSKFASKSPNEEITKAAAVNTTSYAAGMPAVWLDQITLKSHELSYWGRCRQEQLDPQMTMHLPAQGAGATLAYAGEGATLSKSIPSASDVSVTAKKYGFQGDISYDSLKSSSFDILSYISYDAINSIAQGFDNLVFNGDAYAFTGILTNATQTILFGENNGATSYASMKAKNFRQIINSMSKGRGRAGAEFYIGKGLVSDIEVLTLGPSATGTALILNHETEKIMGYKYNESEQIADTDATSTMFGCFCNLRNYAIAIAPTDRGIVMSDSAGENNFLADRVLYKIRLWAAGKMIYADHFTDFGTL